MTSTSAPENGMKPDRLGELLGELDQWIERSAGPLENHRQFRSPQSHPVALRQIGDVHTPIADRPAAYRQPAIGTTENRAFLKRIERLRKTVASYPS